MRVFEITKFIQKYKNRNLINILPLISLSFTASLFLFFYFSKEINLIVLALSFLSGFIISYQSIRLIIENRNMQIIKFLEQLKNHTEKRNDYKCLNYLLLDSSVSNFSKELKTVFKESSIDLNKICYNGRSLLGR